MSTRAVAYLRIAEREPELVVQERAIAGWAERVRVEIASVHVDRGIDGATPIAERPALVAAYRAIRLHAAGVLVGASARSFADDELVARLIERAALVEGAVVCTADGSRGVAHGHTRAAIDLARAYRRVELRARIRRVLAEKKARCERVGNVAFGFRAAADGVHVEPDEREQAVIAAVRKLSTDGLSQRAIARELAARGVVGRTGAPLRQTQIASILRAR